MNTIEHAIEQSAARLRAAATSPRVALLLGSGWAPLAARVQDAVDIDYAELPAFPQPGVDGHAGQVRLGTLGGTPVAVLAGRRHAYEDGACDAMKGPIRTLAAIGVQVLVQTNASGCLVPGRRPGELMLVSDHLNVVQRSPLLHESGSGRFVDMSAAYDPALRALALRVAAERGITLHEGIYAWVLGPQFETPAEIAWLRGIGAHAVGMSTVPETILARHAGLRVLALSMHTNMGAGLSDEALSHAHTLAGAQAASARGVALLEALLAVFARRMPAAP
jgi:purine-nucleoside phosphorylase